MTDKNGMHKPPGIYKPGDWVFVEETTGGHLWQVSAEMTNGVWTRPFWGGKEKIFWHYEIRRATPEEIAHEVTQAIRQEEPNEFDRIGEMYAVMRAPGEDDSHFRKRLLVAVSDPKAAEMSGIGYDVVRDLLLG